MEPLISIVLGQPPHHYQPGETLEVEYQIDAVAAEDLHSVEASVLWHTEGKGDDDFAVHFFERRLRGEADEQDLRPLHTFTVPLPNTPLSYDGRIVKVHWCVRVRIFLKGGKESFFEHPFKLGDVPSQIPPASA